MHRHITSQLMDGDRAALCLSSIIISLIIISIVITSQLMDGDRAKDKHDMCQEERRRMWR